MLIIQNVRHDRVVFSRLTERNGSSPFHTTKDRKDSIDSSIVRTSLLIRETNGSVL